MKTINTINFSELENIFTPVQIDAVNTIFANYSRAKSITRDKIHKDFHNKEDYNFWAKCNKLTVKPEAIELAKNLSDVYYKMSDLNITEIIK